MLIPDVNVLVDAWRADSERHLAARDWLEEAVAGADAVGLPAAVLYGTVRVLTLPVRGLAMRLDDVLAAVDGLLAAPGVLAVPATGTLWMTFGRLVRDVEAVGNSVPDVFLAALAMEHDATLVSSDRSFSSIPGLRWQALSS